MNKNESHFQIQHTRITKKVSLIILQTINPLKTSDIYNNDIFANLLLQLEMKRMAGR
jgi:hypothetical protein